MDERDDDLFEEESLDLYEQDGPSLFEEADADPLPDVAEPPRSETLTGRPEEEVTASLMEAVDSLREPDEVIERPDAPLALYRRYRPDTFAEVIGQEHVTEPLQRALLNNRVHHAYLFSGPRGCGKTTSARILARALNCAKGPAPVPCGECQSCRDLARGGPGSIDVIEIDAASHGGVDDARDLRERAFFAPVHSRYKIYIIDEAHMVTPQGFNAMLKVVEEPPPHVKFIFATTEPEKVIGTIRSRTHHYPFRLVPPKVLSSYLGKVCDAEGIAVEPAVLPLVVRAGAGSVRDSLSVLDQLLGGADHGGVSYSQATALLGYTPDALLDEIVDAFAAGDSHGVFAAVDKVIEVGQDPRRFAEDLLRRLRDLIIVAAVPDALSSGLVDVSADQAERLTSQASALGPGELTRAAEVIAVGLTEMRGTTAPRLHLELMCARVLLPGADVDARGVHARLDRLERLVEHGVVGATSAGTPRDEPSRATADVPAAQEPAPARPAGQRQQATPEPEPAAQPAPEPDTDAPEPPPWDEPDDAPPPSRRPAPSRQQAPAKRPAGEPAPAPQAAAEVAPERRPEPPAQPAPATPATAPAPRTGGFATADLRRLWPDILEDVKNRRRYTWILLSQNSQIVELRDGKLTLGFANPGARDSFVAGSNADVLRDALKQVVGAALHIEPIVDSGGSPSVGRAPAAPAPVEPSSPASPSRSAAAQAARDNLHTRNSPGTPSEPEVEPSRDDDTLDDEASGDELLKKHLGAQLIDDE